MNDADQVIELGKLILKFARVNRATYFEDGKTPESDTDHTVMIGIVGCSLAAKLYPALDVGKIAQYALVHDLVEAYAGDTPSFNISHKEKEYKDEREKEAFETIQRQFATFPWLIESIERYEKLADTEARFVKALDKCMPKITHILNRGTYFKEMGTTKEKMLFAFEKQEKSLQEGYAEEFPELMVLLRSLMNMTVNACFPAQEEKNKSRP